MPAIRVGRAGEHDHGHAVRGRDMVEPRVDAQAQIHAGKQPAHVAERHRRRMVVHVRSRTRGDEPQERVMDKPISRPAAEKHLAAPIGHEPVDDPGKPVEGPQSVLVGRLGCDEHLRPFGGDAGHQGVGLGDGVGGVPGFVVAVVDGEPLAPQEIEEQLGLMPMGYDGHLPREQTRSDRAKAHPPRNACEPGEQGARERSLEQVDPVIAARADPAGVLHDVAERPAHHTAPPGRPPPGEPFVDVRAVGQERVRPRLAEHVDHGVWKVPPQIPQKRHREHRVADEAIAHHENVLRLGGCWDESRHDRH